MEQYLKLAKRIVDDGEWIKNTRTKTMCKTVINETFNYDTTDNKLPLVTTRRAPWKMAIAELLGYIRGYTDAEKFDKLGAKTWYANANDNESWVNNPHRKGENDMGYVYGAVGRGFGGHQPGTPGIDQLQQIVDNLSAGIDSRGEILSFWDPSSFEYGCLRPCMYSHQFSLVDDKMYLTSIQRTVDVPLGLVANTIQVVVLLRLMCMIISNATGRTIIPAGASHHLVNCHIYEDQIDLMKEQLTRTPYDTPTLMINPHIKTLEDLETWVTVDDFVIIGYNYHEPIQYPFSV